ncbi:hypothetical protein A0H81_01217 [Grifola frondosa]|uniref:F-box domain-containing protein n=1 Tax=Grifola frondosa TaxID=5627 RepID=A0A1C7MPC0_GRIFR|nr:hypothetical protein A0H81_01217 [Grifola frondosa]
MLQGRQNIPIEIHAHVLSFLPPSYAEDDTSVKTLVSYLCASSRLRTAARGSLLWKPHYLARYTHCDEEKERKRREEAKGNWYAIRVGVIVRYAAVRTWIRILAGNETVTFEDGHAAFSAFYDISPREISLQIDDLTDRCKRIITEEHWELDPNNSEYDLLGLCLRVRSSSLIRATVFMRMRRNIH